MPAMEPVEESAVPDYGGPREPLVIGGRVMPSRYFLAPLAGYTNLALRLAIRELGGLGTGHHRPGQRPGAAGRQPQGDRSDWHDGRRPPDGRADLRQRPAEMAEAAQLLVDRGVEHIDINMGCPVHKVTENGGGSAMMCDTTGRTIELVGQVVEAVSMPVTVKMRLGWDATQLTAPFFARVREVGVAAITIHGRTRAQGFSGSVISTASGEVVAAVERHSGLRQRRRADHRRRRPHVRVTGCPAIAIGRGALLNPWFFRQLLRWEETGDAGRCQATTTGLTCMSTHVRRLCELRGEQSGCVQFRKVANWYCRVIKPGKVVQQRPRDDRFAGDV